MVTIPEKLRFAHRTNDDGTVDSICRKCFATVATCHWESDLENAERDHVCDPDFLPPLSFEAIYEEDVPLRHGWRYRALIERVLKNLGNLAEGRALKVPVCLLPDTVKNFRSALVRSTIHQGFSIQTSSDPEYFYVWRAEAPKGM
jgi:hypothetical protein